MTEIRIYHGVSSTDLFLARLLQEKLLKNGMQVVVWTESESQAARLDKSLWSKPDERSFIPHCLANDECAERTPVVISDPDHEIVRDALVSMAPEVPHGATSGEHFIVILQDKLDDHPEFAARLDEFARRGYKLHKYDRSEKSQ